MDIQLDEVFDSAETLPVVNLNPKFKVPQLWAIGDVENNVVVRMASYASEGDALKQVKMGDKYAHVILMSLSEKGNLLQLKNGLGPQPLQTLNAIFETVYQNIKKLRMDAVMFRFPTKKLKGQGPMLQRVIGRLVQQRSGGKFKVLPAMYEFTAKYTYILIVRKNANIEEIKGMPEINSELYTKVESDVGDVYIDKKGGNQVTKETALAGSIAAVEEKRSELTAISRTKVSRRAIAASQSLTSDVILDPVKFEEYEASAAEFSKAATAAEIPEAGQIRDAVTSKSAKNRVSRQGAMGVTIRANEIFGHKLSEIEADKINDSVTKEILNKIGDNSTTSVASMQAYIQTALDTIEQFKDSYIGRLKPTFFGSDSEKNEQAVKLWNMKRVKFIKESLKNYAQLTSAAVVEITAYRTPAQYTPAEKRGIKEYVGSGYRDINNMLLGRYDSDNYDTLDAEDVRKTIKNLDDAFAKGDKIPSDLTLWRAQTVRKPIYDAMVKNRVFYFRNYVSTSINPIIFGGWKGNLGVGLTSDNTRNVLNVDKSGENSIIPNNEIRAVQVKGEEAVRVSIGWAIDGADRINVVYPGDISNHVNEMEIILPRGTMLKINKITDASYNDGIEYSNQKFVQAEVMTSADLNEGEVVYDGDVLMETGELQPVSDGIDFEGFVKAKKVSANTEILQLLASFIDIEDMNPRFVS